MMGSDELPSTNPVPFVPQEDPEQVKKRQKELNEVVQSMPVIAEVIADFKEIIESASRTDRLDTESKVPLESQLLGLNELKKFATQEYNKFVSKYTSYEEAAKENV